MLTPAAYPFTVYRGGTFNVTIKLRNGTEPFDLTGWMVELEIGEIAVLKEGSGLTVNDEEGEIAVEMDTAETLKSQSREHYVLSISKEGVVYFPLRGPMNFEDA